MDHGSYVHLELKNLTQRLVVYLMATHAMDLRKPFSLPKINFPYLALMLGLVLLPLLGGCDAKEASLPPEAVQPDHASEPINSNTTSIASPGFPRIVALGDSLTAGLGVSPDQSYPAQLQERLDQAGFHYRVINAGVSGDTTAGGLRRLDWILKSKPRIVIVELGTNDALRGQPLATMYSNLEKIINRLQNAETAVVIAGMKIPPNYGLDYTKGFESIFEQLAREHRVTLIPFLLEGVAARPELNQADGIHPTAAGYQIVADTVMQALLPLLGSQDSR
jgi:acyl-CoA thioesterase I